MRISDWSSCVYCSELTAATVRIVGEVHKAPDPATLTGEAKADAIAVFKKDLQAGLTRSGYPAAADPDQVDKVKVIAILCIFGLLATMVYGPLAALLVELFPARIRYSSLSLPSRIGNG